MNEVSMKVSHRNSFTSKEVSQEFILFSSETQMKFKNRKTSGEKRNSFETEGMAQTFSHRGHLSLQTVDILTWHVRMPLCDLLAEASGCLGP